MNEKDDLRLRCKAVRDALTDRSERSTRILRRAFGLERVIAAQTLFTYIAKGSEVETLSLLSAPGALAKRIAVPFMVDDRMHIAEIRDPSELAPGQYQILEPVAAVRSDPTRVVSEELIDVAFIPALAFDRRGHRLGYGKGHFDRVLPSLARRAMCIGLAFDDQVVARLPSEPHDYAVDIIVTESEVIRCTATDG